MLPQFGSLNQIAVVLRSCFMGPDPNPKTLETWDEIISELQSVCSDNSARNLVGQNPLITSFLARRNAAETPDLDGGSALYSEDVVRQN